MFHEVLELGSERVDGVLKNRVEVCLAVRNQIQLLLDRSPHSRLHQVPVNLQFVRKTILTLRQVNNETICFYFTVGRHFNKCLH